MKIFQTFYEYDHTKLFCSWLWPPKISLIHVPTALLQQTELQQISILPRQNILYLNVATMNFILLYVAMGTYIFQNSDKTK